MAFISACECLFLNFFRHILMDILMVLSALFHVYLRFFFVNLRALIIIKTILYSSADCHSGSR